MKTTLIMWIVFLVAFIITEAATAQLVTIWFAAGALAALIADVLHASVLVQWIVFVSVSAVALIATRPLVKKFKKVPHQATNADRIIGQTAVVTEDIDNIAAKGRVQAGGMSWSARSENGEKIQSGETVTVERIDGVKLIVK